MPEITRRDYFIAAAMQGLLASGDYIKHDERTFTFKAIGIADRMIQTITRLEEEKKYVYRKDEQ